jgi:PAS domain S-box-containing protein
MTKTTRTKAKPVTEAEALRQRVAELEAANAECRQTQTALQVSEIRYRRLFETTQDGILILDADTGRITDVNPFLVNMLGYSDAQLLGKQLWEIGLFKDITAARAAFSELQTTGYIRYEDFPLQARDGRRLNVEFVSNIYQVEQQRVIQCNLRDITARRRAEVTLSQSLVELQARTEDLDAFAQTVAHDLKNPVHLITGYAEVLAKYFPTMSDEERQRALNVIVRSGQKVGKIIDELLMLAELHKSEVETKPLDMASIVAESVGRLTDDISGIQAEIVWPGTPQWPAALGHGPWVEEVWVNYLSNALKYGGAPLVAPYIELGAALQPDGMARYWVRDHGPGITPETQFRLFAPFTHLNQVRPIGHGLGLSIVRRIMEKLGGQVGLESQVGEGSTFYVTLPTAQ